MVPVLAHGTGIDELLWFVVPLVVAMAFMRFMERRKAARGSKANHRR